MRKLTDVTGTVIQKTKAVDRAIRTECYIRQALNYGAITPVWYPVAYYRIKMRLEAILQS